MAPDHQAILQLIEQEKKGELNYQQFLAHFEKISGADKNALELLMLKDKQHRLAYYLESYKLWTRLISFKFIKALLASAVITAVIFALVFRSSSWLYFAATSVGLALFYFTTLYLIHKEGKTASRKISEISSNYIKQLDELRDKLT